MIQVHSVRRGLSLAAALLLAALALVVTTNAADAATLSAHGSVNQVYVTGATPGAQIQLLNKKGKRVDKQKVGSLGGALFRDVKAGPGYRVKQGSTKSPAITVMRDTDAPPSTAGYGQTIPSDGYGYLTTRDGTSLAINVHKPTLPTPGPYPTLIEYSGYGYARPGGGESSIAQIANILGFAVVDVNMRGTGCSGGAFDYFEKLESLDGYDVVETVARQPWVLHNKVGMMGISYGGISQMFVGQTNPPSLAAITPLSVIDNTATTLYPGGILNTGFALSWAKDRVHDALPASETGGQPWALDRIKGGDATCKANQTLHPEAVDLLKKIDKNQFYVPKVADPLSPVTFVHKIKMPVFMACQWTDEQTGGHCADLAQNFTGTNRKWFSFTNGTHIDSLDPATFNHWYDFMMLYVAKQNPLLPVVAKAAAPVIYNQAMGINGVTLPLDPVQSQLTYAAALKTFEAIPSVTIRFDNGAGGIAPGYPDEGYTKTAAKFPLPGTQAQSWYMGAGGALTPAKPAKSGSNSFTWNPGARPANDFTGDTAAGGLWQATPAYSWSQSPAGTALSYVTPALPANTSVVGGGSVQAWIKSSAKNVDLQVTVSEIRPDNKETFVQGGWLRTSLRKLDKKKSTPLEPVLSLRKKDATTLPKGKWTPVTIPLYYEGHAYRKGSRIAIRISAPGGDQPIWAFGNTKPAGSKPKVSIAYGKKQPSRVTLPVVAGLSVPTALPPCPGLRGEPCRTYQPLVNGR